MTSELERITRLEEGQKALQETVQKLADLQADQAEMQGREHAQTRKEIMILADKFSSAGKPNYSVLISAAVFTMALIGAILSPAWSQIQDNKQKVEALTTSFYDHQTMPSHPVSTAVMAEREKQALREAELQRQILEAKFQALETKLTKP
jgi:hypothetical protein